MNSLGGVLHGLPCPDSRAERAELLAMLGTLTAQQPHQEQFLCFFWDLLRWKALPSPSSQESALDGVEPGDVIIIESGNYFEDLETVTAGTEDARITIKGANGSSGRESVVLRGAGVESRVFQLKHDYYTLQDFTIDGQVWDDDAIEGVDEDNSSEAYRDILLYVASKRTETERSGGYMSALDGLIVSGMILQNAGQECFRLRHIGTPLDGWADADNYSGGEDICLGNIISNNEIMTDGNEGVDVKEGCLDTVIEYNNIAMQNDPHSAAVNSQGDDTTIVGNTIADADGAGVRIGSTTADEDGRYYGVNNIVTGNTITNCFAAGVEIMSSPQGDICGNDIMLPDHETEATYNYAQGVYGGDYKPFKACYSSSDESTPGPSATPSTLAPSAIPDTPAPSPGISTPAPSMIPGAVYLGCFLDEPGERTMDVMAYKSKSSLTNEECIEHCKEDGKRFAGTIHGYMCRCTNYESNVYWHGETDNCNIECPQESAMPCGGDWAVTSWEVTLDSSQTEWMDYY
eukprot:jgi/Undpi1/1202/HiC_scaffold_104.g14116.m1